MRSHLLLLVVLIGIGSCKEVSNVKQASSESAIMQETRSLDWLIGNWVRTNDQEGRNTFEHWQKESAQLYRGLGFTLVASDTVFKEELEIRVTNGNWNLVVTGVNEVPTYFAFTSQSDNSFICENEANEFPKKIEYVCDEEKITATVSGGGEQLAFIFVKQ